MFYYYYYQEEPKSKPTIFKKLHFFLRLFLRLCSWLKFLEKKCAKKQLEELVAA